MNTHKTFWRWPLVVGTFYPVLFVLIYLYLSLVQPSHFTMTQPISYLELRPNGWVQHLNFVMVGLCTIAFGFGFYRSMKQFTQGKWLRVCMALFCVSGVGYIMGGLFTYDPRTRGTVGVLHGLGYILMTLCFLVVLFIVGFKFLHLPTFRKVGVYSLITLSIIVAILAFQQIPIFQNVTASFGGLLNRGFMIILNSWYVAIGDFLLGVTIQRR